ncbi:MAG: prephenate dehydrogenase/arogenate dehydrogenase family protein [Firmicutes bacterium]|nr:prephenate dehydrogenase/arogenate dehydrogenase family protein [Bacillota bacterium]
MEDMNIGIVGAGNVGVALAMALKEKGFKLGGLCCRTEESARRASEKLGVTYSMGPEEVTRHADIVFITTPDRVIGDVCREIAQNGGFRDGQVVLHTSGAHDSTLLEPAKQAGANILSMHPLQTFPSSETGFQNLPGSYFTLEGDERALEVGQKLVAAFEGVALTIPTEMKPLYHASACVVCNYFVALIDLGLKMMEVAGVDRREALPAMMPLIEGTLANMKRVGVPKALTGPIDRGDASTIGRHMEKMKEAMPRVMEIYRLLGRFTAEVAEDKGTLSGEGKKNIIGALS